MSGEIDGTITRQLLPWAARTVAGNDRAKLRAMWRYVTWHVRPMTLEQAQAHLRIGGANACIVAVERGPKGGWTGAEFRMAAAPLPSKRTMHYGWVHVDKHCRDTMPPEDQWWATLELHAPGTEVT